MVSVYAPPKSLGIVRNTPFSVNFRLKIVPKCYYNWRHLFIPRVGFCFCHNGKEVPFYLLDKRVATNIIAE